MKHIQAPLIQVIKLLQEDDFSMHHLKVAISTLNKLFIPNLEQHHLSFDWMDCRRKSRTAYQLIFDRCIESSPQILEDLILYQTITKNLASLPMVENQLDQLISILDWYKLSPDFFEEIIKKYINELSQRTTLYDNLSSKVNDCFFQKFETTCHLKELDLHFEYPGNVMTEHALMLQKCLACTFWIEAFQEADLYPSKSNEYRNLIMEVTKDRFEAYRRDNNSVSLLTVFQEIRDTYSKLNVDAMPYEPLSK